MPWTFYNANGQRLSSAATNISVLDIDGATDIGAAIVDADLFIIDDGAGGTNRKTAASRIATYIGTGSGKSVRVYDGSTQSISNNSRTAVAFDTENYDTDTMHDASTNNDRLIAKTAGKYIITGNIGFAANATGEREAWIYHSADGDIAAATRAAEGDRTNYMSVTTAYDMAVDEYVVLQVYQNSGGSLSVNNGIWHNFSLTKISG
jgi:hypothetical protein